MIEILVIIGASALLWRWVERRDDTCPDCGNKLTDRGFEGWKECCRDCGWKN